MMSRFNCDWLVEKLICVIGLCDNMYTNLIGQSECLSLVDWLIHSNDMNSLEEITYYMKLISMQVSQILNSVCKCKGLIV